MTPGIVVSGSSVHEVFQVNILEWVDFPPPGDLPNLGTEPGFPESLTPAGGLFSTAPPGKPPR